MPVIVKKGRKSKQEYNTIHEMDSVLCTSVHVGLRKAVYYVTTE